MNPVEKLLEMAASWRREADEMEQAGAPPSTTLAIRANADELTASISREVEEAMKVLSKFGRGAK